MILATKTALLMALILLAARPEGRAYPHGVIAQNDPSGTSVWEGVYSETQAARGKQRYEASCAECHREDLSGGEARPLIAPRFWEAWGEDSLNSLFSLMRTTMPQGEPGSLGDQAYLDIVAYILQKNGYPSGRGELTTEHVGAIRVIRKEGPGPVPNFSLVTVVGCLRELSRGVWVLTNSSEPVRTRNPDASTDTERRRSDATRLGATTFELMDVHEAGHSHDGHKMEVKGLLIRGKPDRVNVTSIQMLAERCTR